MQKEKKFYQDSIENRRKRLQKHFKKDFQFDKPLTVEKYDRMIENAVGTFELPMGMLLKFPMNGKEYSFPMVTEEPSVIAAANNAAKIFRQNDGIQAKVKTRIMRGQIAFPQWDQALIQYLEKEKEKILDIANDAHPSIVKRGGGACDCGYRILEEDGLQSFLVFDLFVDTQEAMGANIINTMLEALKNHFEDQFKLSATMAILSNLNTEAIATAKVKIAIPSLKHGKKTAEKMQEASDLAQIDPYRAATHNKGIMNGIDAFVIASGNDWRAIEAAAHSYAAINGQYRGLSQWKYEKEENILAGSIALPVPIGSVGGTMHINPQSKLTHQMIEADAKTMMKLVASIGLAQNFSALYALVSDGIQKGHMRLHMRSLAIAVGAKEDEIDPLVQALAQETHQNQETAKRLLKEIRA